MKSYRAITSTTHLAMTMGIGYAVMSGYSSKSMMAAFLGCLGLLFWILRKKNPESHSLRLAHLCVLPAMIPTFYAATGPLITSLGLANKDDALMSFDRLLFSNFFPDGQISFFFDQSVTFGPHTFLGKLLTEVLQTAYFSYYIWGYLLAIFLIIAAFRKKESHLTADAFISAWVGAYLVNFISYIFVPAIGPQFVFAGQYVHEFTGFDFIANTLRKIVADNQGTIQDCFPSGHTAISCIAALYAAKWNRNYSRIAGTAAALIICATLYLRYHYIADIFAATFLIYLALIWGSFFELPFAGISVTAKPQPVRPLA